MAERTCYNCVYCCCDPCLWLRLLRVDEPLLPRCANHPLWAGQLHDVPGVPCRNYRPRPTTPEGEGVRMIPLTAGGYAYVDAADYEWLKQWTWRVEDGYAVRHDNRKKILMHHQIMQPPKGMVVDHIDGNRANNCRANLRVCTRSQNCRNSRKRGGVSSVYKGVGYDKRKRKWYAKCQYQGEPVWLGFFDSEADAARAYDCMAVELFGEFARLNFPREWPPQRRAEVYTQRQEKEEQVKSEKGQVKSKRGRGRKRGERSERVPKRDVSRLGSQSRLQAGRTSPTRVNAELPTPKPQAPGRSAKAKGKKKKGKTPVCAGTRGHTKKGRMAERNEKNRKKV
jgi:hypothetical protein